MPGLKAYYANDGVWRGRGEAPPDPPPGDDMWIGAAQNVPDRLLPSFQASSADMGPWTVHRTFTDPQATIPTTKPSIMSGDLAAGFLSFYSIKVSGGPTSITAGTHDANLTSLFQAFPTDRPTFFTMWHEPENDITDGSFTSAQFIAMIAHLWDVKQASTNAANVKVGYVAMDYWWRAGTTFRTNPNQMLPPSGKYDYLAVDDYNDAGDGVTPGPGGNVLKRTSLGNDAQFLGWFNWAKTKGKPLYVAEFGRKVDPTNAQARPQEILDSEQFCLDNGIEMFLYWNGTGNQGDWAAYDEPTKQALRAIASRGRPAV